MALAGPGREELRELAHFIDDPEVPRPVRTIARLLLWVVGTGGWIGLSIVQALIVPLVFAVVHAVASEQAQPRVDGTRVQLDRGLGTARRELRALAHLARRRRELPPAK